MSPRSVGLQRATAAALSAVSLAAAQAASDRGAPGAAGEWLAGAPPAAGLYDARFCVTVGTGAANCGPAIATIDDNGNTLVRIADFAYRLQVYAEQLGVSLFHGTMQIDGFFARYQWQGPQLQFFDPEKSTRYELKIGTRRFDTP